MYDAYTVFQNDCYSTVVIHTSRVKAGSVIFGVQVTSSVIFVTKIKMIAICNMITITKMMG